MFFPFYFVKTGKSAKGDIVKRILLDSGAVFVAGAKAPSYARGMGFNPTTTFEEAFEQAKKIVGPNPKVLCTPECFSGGVAVHLHARK